MSNRLAFQTQLASIMEALANAAVAEICKLVDDDYAVVRLQMTQCQTENKVLKRKLHLLELKMARGNAERRLRESVLNRPRVQISAGDRLRQPSPSSDGVFLPRLDVGLWSERAAKNPPAKLPQSEDLQSRSPEVELVEPEAVTVKEEKVEPNGSEEEKTEPDVQLIGDDGVVDPIPFGAAGSLLGPQDKQPQSLSRTQSRRRKRSGSSRGVETEEEPDVVLVKVEEGTRQTGLSIQEGVVESSTDNYRGVRPLDDTSQSSTNPLPDEQERVPDVSEFDPATKTASSPSRHLHRSQPGSDYSLFELETFFTRWAPDSESVAPRGGASCSFTTGDSTEGGQDGVVMVDPETQRPGFSSTLRIQPSGSQDMLAPFRKQPSWSRAPALQDRSAQLLQRADGRRSSEVASSLSSAAVGTKRPPSVFPVGGANTGGVPGERRRRSYICRVCGKAFSGLSNLEAHKRVHTGERPFRCDSCGKHFSEAGNLKKHQRVHTGEKPFACDQCGKRFAWICNLRTHQQSATGCAPQVRGQLA